MQTSNSCESSYLPNNLAIQPNSGRSKNTQIECLFNQIAEFARRNSNRVLFDFKDQSISLWSTRDLPEADLLAEIANSFLEESGSGTWSAPKLEKILQSAEGTKSNAWALGRFISTHSGALQDLAPQSNTARKALELVAELKTLARSKLYYNVIRKFKGVVDGVNLYDYIVYFHALEGRPRLDCLSDLWQDLKEALVVPEGSELRHAVRKRPLLSSVNGPLRHWKDVLHPGCGVSTYNGVLSSVTCVVARAETPDRPLILGSGHGLSDHYSIARGDSVFRIRRRVGDSLVRIGQLVDYEQPSRDGGGQVPILRHDYGLVEPTGDFSLSNVVPPVYLGKNFKTRPLHSIEYETDAVAVRKVGFASGVTDGISQSNKVIVSMVDTLGNVVTFLDQITIEGGSAPFVKYGDSGALLYTEKDEQIDGIGSVTGSNMSQGNAAFSYASHLSEYMENNSLVLFAKG